MQKAEHVAGTNEKVTRSKATPYIGAVFDLSENLSAYISYRIGKNSEATLNVNNVFNTRYRTLSTFLAYGEARSAVLGFKYRF